MSEIKYMSIHEILTELKQTLINHFIDEKMTDENTIQECGRIGELVDEIENRINHLWRKEK